MRVAPGSARSPSMTLSRGAMRADRGSPLAIVTGLARSPGLWLTAALLAAVFLMPKAAPLMRWVFPGDPRPVYTRASFFELTLAHVELVAVSSLAAAAIGIGLGIFVTREGGREFSAMAGAI